MSAIDYLVNHGRSAFLGRFRNRTEQSFAYGDGVVVRTARGIEAGVVLSEAPARFAHLLGENGVAEILRPLADDDRRCEAELIDRANALLHDAQAAADQLGLPVSIVDLEILLAGSPAVLHVLPFDDCDLTALATSLSERHGLLFTIQDLRQKTADEPEGCGKPGCGSTGGGCGSCGTGGCSTGSCSAGAVKSADH